ncbi:hypothetical protein AXF42_Ash000801 [Apostasia shenzhenica]|uniref:Uncharacterized protein n=1 Tax=Apostasia shenzhenica TaxID=1088818 RepID=A0A2I0AT27_9ASPA|nr:hypothetical protein AXF42_Ash000801 [Apostasia shenzhenica]
MQLPPNAVTMIYCLIKELRWRWIPWDIDIFKAVFRWETNPRLHGCFVLKGRYCQVFKRVGEVRFLGEGLGYEDPRFREVDEIRKRVHDAEDYLCELEDDVRVYIGQPELELRWFRIRHIGNKRVPHDRPGPSRLPAKKRRVVPGASAEGVSSAAPLIFEEGVDDLAYIDDVQVSDDPEEQCGRREDEMGSSAEGLDSVGPSIEESGDGVRDEPPRVVPEGRSDSVTRLGAQAADMLDVVRRHVEQLTKEAMAQERKAKENGLLYLESERRHHLAEKRLRSAMRGLEESNRREAELQRLLEETFDQSLEETRKKGVAEFRQSLEFKTLIKEASESSMNMLSSALLDWGLVSREDLEGLDMNECILLESHSYQCLFFKMSAEKMGRMFAFVSNMKVAIRRGPSSGGRTILSGRGGYRRALSRFSTSLAGSNAGCAVNS